VERGGHAGGRCGVPMAIPRGGAARDEQDSPTVKLRHPLLHSLELRPALATSDR
jgi:hypothetical protein